MYVRYLKHHTTVKYFKNYLYKCTYSPKVIQFTSVFTKKSIYFICLSYNDVFYMRGKVKI